MPRWSYYRKTLILILFIACLPSAFIALASYVTITRPIETGLFENYSEKIKNISAGIVNQLSQFEVVVSQWANSPLFDEKLAQVDFKDHFRNTMDLYKTLTNLKEYNPLVDQIQIYIDSRRQIFSSDNGVELIADEQVYRKWNSIVNSGNDLAWTSEAGQDGGSGISLVYKLQGYSHTPYGLLIIRISSEEILHILEQLSVSTSSHSFLLDRDGHVLFEGDHTDAREPTFDRDIVLNEIAAAGGKNGSFALGIEGDRFAVSYGTFAGTSTGWRYVTVTPLSQITRPIRIVSQVLLGISAAGLMTAIILSLAVTKVLVRPLRRLFGLLQKNPAPVSWRSGLNEFEALERSWHHLIGESEKLNKKYSETVLKLRMGFLAQFLQGDYLFWSEDDILDKMVQYGWEIRDKAFGLLIFHLEDKPGERLTRNDPLLLTFAAANIAEELAQGAFEQFQSINFHHLCAGVLVIIPNDEPYSRVQKKLSDLSERIYNTIAALLKIRVKAGMIRITDQITELPTLIHEAKETFAHSSDGEEEKNRASDLEGFMPRDRNAAGYPFEVERDLLFNLRMGKRAETLAKLSLFIDFLYTHCKEPAAASQGVLLLLGSIYRIQMLAGYHSKRFTEDLDRSLTLLSESDAPQLSHFLKSHVLEPYFCHMESKEDLRMHEIIAAITESVERSMASNLSLEQFAELHGVNIHRLSAAFKRQQGITFTDYLTDVRIERAKEFLIHTEMKINDIAEQVGYHPPYFNRVFKKLEGITPGQFRQLHNGN